MKTDTIEFDTTKTINEIVNALRSFRCNIEKLQADPFGDIGGISYQIEVLMSGAPKGLAKLKHPGGAYALWGVQVCVADLGNRRHVELTALGEGGFGAGMRYTYGDGGKSYNIKFSKDFREQIAQAIS